MTHVAILGLIVLFGLVVFQLMLILGKPLGNYAWGGQHRILPRKLRVASIFSIALYLLFAIFLISAAYDVGIISNDTVLTTGMWVFTIYFALGIFMNSISRSKKERIVMTPVALVLALVFLITALPL